VKESLFLAICLAVFALCAEASDLPQRRRAGSRLEDCLDDGVVEKLVEKRVRRGTGRDAYNSEFGELEVTTRAENTEWTRVQEAETPDTTDVNIHIDFVPLKKMNTSEGSKFPTATINHFVTLLKPKLQALAEAHGAQYFSNIPFKGIRGTFRGASDPARLMVEVQAIYRRTLREYADDLRARGVLRPEDHPEDWFRGGIDHWVELAEKNAKAARTQTDENLLVTPEMADNRQRMDRAARSAEYYRDYFQKNFGNTEIMMMGENGLMHPTPRVFAVLKEARDGPDLFPRMLRAFRIARFSEQDAEWLFNYWKRLRETEPEPWKEEKVIANIDHAEHGGIVIDYRGWGAMNQSSHAGAIAGHTDGIAALQAARRGERTITQIIRGKVDALMEKFGTSGKVTGDDAYSNLYRDLNFRERKAAFEALAGDPRTSEIRATFVPAGVKPAERTAMGEHGNAIEKHLRKLLSEEIPVERLERLVFAMDMRAPRNGPALPELGYAEIGLLIANAPGLSRILPADLAVIRAKFPIAVERLNFELQAKRQRALYRADDRPPPTR
jgi:hypothetical protein